MCTTQTAIIKNFHSNPMRIASRVRQGLPCSGDMFCLMILPIFLAIKGSKIIQPYQISSEKINPKIPKNFLSFPRILAFSDDMLVLTKFQINENDECPQVKFIMDIHDEFRYYSGLNLNPSKSELFLALAENSLISRMCTKYGH